ncbi:PIKK family atypical protein kinase [Histomonas meleagridis]|uniref:PIKK family atypical protein kinase n=1 Tax=Histomonas meleagridis TaxID=135588 RepID=UPI00355A2F5A|nr:PIKK family atypical protein kinase [Histomonas meleagridis]KAH0805253.1 PIKK family atypical protein kinase [Histomonas meleagridis]
MIQTQGSFNTVWSNLKRFYGIIKDKFNGQCAIELSDVSETLAKKKSFLLSVPGTYKINGPSPIISRLDPNLPILSTQQRPRLLYMYDTGGTRWKFLLKGNEDLRLDQRIMQFFGLINSLLSSNKATSGLRINISKYPIIPFAPNAGLISWVTGADTLHQLVMDYRKTNGISSWLENDLIANFACKKLDVLTCLQKIELWDVVSPKCPANELRETLWERAPDAVTWIKCVDTFTLSTALMSLAGYIIGLGDRHPSNIMVQRQTGHVVHIDFGDSFEVALNRDKMPEKVPFRLTRMLINAFGVSGVEGQFRNACEVIMRMLRNNKSCITAQLEIFVHEPIFVNKDNGMFEKGKTRVLDRVIEKLSGKDPIIDGNEQVELNPERQVDELIKVASDPYMYVNHFSGWCQFW